MKLLLTSAGIKNTSIHNALVDLLGKPIAEASALCIPTAMYGHPMVAPGGAWRFISGREPETPMCELGWQSLGVLELTALPSIDAARWVPWVQATDVLLVSGGDALYLCHWMRQSGLADLLPSLRETVWVGLSAGSMVMTPRIGQDFVGWQPPTGSDSTLGVVDFSIFPHLDHAMLPENTLADAERWAAGLDVPAYAIDDETAIKVVDGAVEVISEGHWKWYSVTSQAHNPVETHAWDAAEHLESEEDRVAYLEAALEDGDTAVILAALGDITRAKGMSHIAREAGMGRESLYKALSPTGNPEFATILKVIAALGLRLHVRVASSVGSG